MSPSSKVGRRWCSSHFIERLGVHGVVVGLGRDDASQAQADTEGNSFVMPMRNTGVRNIGRTGKAKASAAMLVVRRRLHQQHQFQRIEIKLTVEPSPSPLKDIQRAAHSRARIFFKRDVVAVRGRGISWRHRSPLRTLQTVADFVEHLIVFSRR